MIFTSLAQTTWTHHVADMATAATHRQFVLITKRWTVAIAATVAMLMHRAGMRTGHATMEEALVHRQINTCVDAVAKIFVVI